VPEGGAEDPAWLERAALYCNIRFFAATGSK